MMKHMTGRSILVTVCLKKVFLVGTNILITSMVIGQVNFGFRQTDSLKHELSKATVDTSKAILMVSLAEAYRWSKPDSAMVGFVVKNGWKILSRMFFEIPLPLSATFNSTLSLSLVVLTETVGS